MKSKLLIVALMIISAFGLVALSYAKQKGLFGNKIGFIKPLVDIKINKLQK